MTLPAVPDTFSWTHEPWGDALVCRPLAEIAQHLFTTRQLELRLGGDHAGGWKDVAGALGVDTEHLVRLRQVHGREVFVVRGQEARRAEADAIVSNDPSIGVAVHAADCVPVLIADPRTGAVAAVHAGWRGTAAGAVPAAVAAMTREFGTRAVDLVAAIGPSIGPCCYEVGPDVINAFAAAGHRRERLDRWFTPYPNTYLRLDLWTATCDQLIDAGLNERNVHTCGLCTATRVDVFYSFRVEGEQAGRLAAAIRAGA